MKAPTDCGAHFHPDLGDQSTRQRHPDEAGLVLRSNWAAFGGMEVRKAPRHMGKDTGEVRTSIFLA